MTGALLALISAAIFGFQNAAARRAVVSATPLQGMVLTVPTVVPLLGVGCYLMGGFDAMQDWPVASYIYAGLAGLMHFVIGRNSNYHSMRALGSTLSTPIQQVSTIMSLFLAVVVLKESFSGLNIVGIGLVMVGPAMLIGRRKSIAAAAVGQRFIPDMKTGMIHGAVCVVGYGSSPVLIVLALAAVGNPADKIAHSTAILFLSYLCAAGGVAVMVAFTGGRASLRSIAKNGLNWFLLSGFMIAISQIFRYGALAFAPVGLVVPIQRLSVIFRLLFNRLINRDYERFDSAIVIGILLSVLGVAALGVDTELALAWLHVGPYLYDSLNWRF
jgi:drug/metabolite transporter (DMT)-like permease